MKTLLLSVSSATLALALSALSAQAALIKQSFTGDLYLIDPAQALFQRPSDAVLDEAGGYGTDFELSYIFDDEKLPVYEYSEDGESRHSFVHGGNGEGLALKAAGQTFDISRFGRSFGDLYGGLKPADNWYSIGFGLKNFIFGFSFSSNNPLDNAHLPTAAEQWHGLIYGPTSADFFGSAYVETTAVSYLPDAEPIPAPGLLPGLIGLGLATWRRKAERFS